MLTSITNLTPRPMRAGATPIRSSAARASEATEQVNLTRFDLAATLEKTRAQAASLEQKLAEHTYVAGEVLVRLAPGFDSTGVADFASSYGARVATRFDVPASMRGRLGGELVKLKLPAGLSVAQALTAMEYDPRVLGADSNDVLQIPRAEQPTPQPPPSQPAPQPPSQPPGPVLPNDLVGELWGLQNTGQNEGQAGVDIHAGSAWQVSTGSRTGPIVAIIDTGVDAGHPELTNNMWTNPGEIPGDGIDNDNNGVIDDVHGYSGVDGSGNPIDDNGHGTHCAGTIGAEGNNGSGVVGVNWQAQMMALKFLGAGGGGTTEDAIKCVLYASKMGARITSNSWSGDKYNQILYDALKASPALHVCAAGNDGYDNDIKPIYPASYQLDNVLSIAAHDNKDRLARFSNRGEASVHLAAPGVDIYSTKPGGDYQTMSGTSMATPHVAGVAALIATAYPEASNEDIRRRLLSGVDAMPEPFNHRLVTGGRMNAAKALEKDDEAPGEVVDLKANSQGAQGVSLTWTAPGDDGYQGRANGYELRFSPASIVEGEPKPNEVAFEDAQPVPVAAPKPNGAQETVQVQLKPSGKERRLHFALRAIDNVGNRGPLSFAQARIPGVPVAFEDTFDHGQQDWTPEGSWAQVEESGRGQVWTDSPDGDYQYNTNFALTGGEIDLGRWKNSKLYFDAKQDIETRHDGCKIEVYGKKGWFGGTKWREEASLDGISDWKTHAIDLSAYDGQKVKIRFRMESDDSRARDGIYLDHVVVTGDRQAGNSQA